MENIELDLKQTKKYFYLTAGIIIISLVASFFLLISYFKLNDYSQSILQRWDIHHRTIKRLEDLTNDYYHTIIQTTIYHADVKNDLDNLKNYERDLNNLLHNLCQREIFNNLLEEDLYLDFNCKDFQEDIKTLEKTKKALIRSIKQGDEEMLSWLPLLELEFEKIHNTIDKLSTYSKLLVELTIQKTKNEITSLLLFLISLGVFSFIAIMLYLTFSKKSFRNIKELIKELKKKNEKLKKFNSFLEKKVIKRTNQLEVLNKELNKKRDYDIKQQKLAREKQEFITVNDLKDSESWQSRVVYKASDILSGDGFSVFENKNGDLIYFIIDGQGHGISPSLTVFSIATTIKQNINNGQDLKTMTQYILETASVVLGDFEQLSYTIIWISNNNKKIEYAIGGMYETLLKADGKIISLESNNTPIMNFMDTITVNSIEIENFSSIISHSDGLLEDDKIPKYFAPDKLINDPSQVIALNGFLKHQKPIDDVTLILLEKLY